MADITAESVKALREMTDLPMMMCKKALVKAEGNQEKAIEILREEAGKDIVKRADNPTSEGRIAIRISDDCMSGVMIELQCESPPVAGSELFVDLSEKLTEQLLTGPGAGSPDELLAQPVPGHKGQTLKALYDEIVGKIREKIVVARITRVEGPVAGYVHHTGKMGVLFRASGGKEACAPVLRDVAMHIAALSPMVTQPEELDPALIQAERSRLMDEARETGKPENIIEKIVDGRMKTFYVEHGVLVHQPFAKDDAKTVSQALAESGMKAVSFTRWVIGT